MEQLTGGLVTVLTTLAIAAGSALIALGQRRMERKMDEQETKAADEQARRDSWREGMSARTGRLEAIIDTILELQLSQMRSDLVHRAHRYVDDRGAASTEEKDVFWQQYQDYIRLCDAHGKDNNFIDRLAQQVMDLPTRDYEKF